MPKVDALPRGDPSLATLTTCMPSLTIDWPPCRGDMADAIAPGMEPMIPLRSRRKAPRDYDQDPYRLCHLVENAFLNLKQGEAMETRYTKNAASFGAICQIREPILWTKLF